MVWLTEVWWQVVTPPAETIPTAPPPNFIWIALGIPLIIVAVGAATVVWLRWRESHGSDM